MDLAALLRFRSRARLTRYSAQRCGVTLVSLPAAESMVYRFWWCQLPRHTKSPSLLPVALSGIARDRMPCDKRRSPSQRNSRLTCRSVCCRTQRHNGQPAVRPDIHKRPYRNRQYPPHQGAVCRADQSSADDRGRRYSHSDSLHQPQGCQKAEPWFVSALVLQGPQHGIGVVQVACACEVAGGIAAQVVAF
jgi:hypothetical protein